LEIGELRLQETHGNSSLVSNTWFVYCRKAKGVIEEAENKKIITRKEGNTYVLDQTAITGDATTKKAFLRVAALLRFETLRDMTPTILLDGQGWFWVYNVTRRHEFWQSSKNMWDEEEYAQNLLARYNYDPEMSCSAILERKE